MQLRAAREASGKTQAQVAEESGVAEAVYQRYEYNKNTPSVTTAIRIAKAVNSTVEALFGAATPQSENDPDGNPTESSQQQDITTRAGFQRPKGTERNGKGDTNAKGELSRKP